MTSSSSSNQRINSLSQGSDSGILNERILVLVFESIKWDIQILCLVALVSRKLRAIAKRLLWRELCSYRAPLMVATLTTGSVVNRFGGGWHALGKLLLFCCGSESTRNLQLTQPLQGHLVNESRFSKTSGKSFLTRKCRGDLLYVCDPCEHSVESNENVLGVFRGVFREFIRSKTRACLIGRQVPFDDRVRCPYCGARVWSMTTARLVPRSAARRVGSHEDGLEYFVCVNGHLHGACWLVPLSSDDEDDSNNNNDASSVNADGDNNDETD